MKECSFQPSTNPNKGRKASKIRTVGLGDKVGTKIAAKPTTEAPPERKKIARGKSISLIQSQYVDKYLAKPRLK